MKCLISANPFTPLRKPETTQFNCPCISCKLLDIFCKLVTNLKYSGQTSLKFPNINFTDRTVRGVSSVRTVVTKLTIANFRMRLKL